MEVMGKGFIARMAGLGLMLAVFSANANEPIYASHSGTKHDPTAVWSAWAGQTTLRFDPSLMDSYALQISGLKESATKQAAGGMGFRILPLGTLQIWAPAAAFDGFHSGQLTHDGGFKLVSNYGSVDVRNFSLRASPDQLELQVVSAAGEVLFTVDHIHAMLRPEVEQVTLWNMDLVVAPALAKQLGIPELDGTVIGQAFTSATLNIPASAKLGGTCPGAGQANWHDGILFNTDVALINIGSVGQRAREPGVRVVFAPSATLQNVGTADVPWFEKFTTTAGGNYPPPYNRDQHPFLVWAMYKLEDDGVFRQIAVSDVKHAFFTVNSSCQCSGGSILYAAGSTPNNVGCVDTYGQGNNDSPPDLGPRDEIPSRTGAWEQCGSFFAPGGTAPGPCNQTNGSGQPNGEFDRRMNVAESDLDSGNPNYWLDSWYVIRDDINIFNNMGYRQLTPEQNGSGVWQFGFGGGQVGDFGPFVEGAGLDAWIPPNTNTGAEAHTRVQTPLGHFSIAVDTVDLGNGMLRVVYALMNYDYDTQFRSFSIPMPDHATNVRAFTPDGTVFTPTINNGIATWEAPVGEGLDWGKMATFTFEAEGNMQAGVVTTRGLEQTDIRNTNLLVFNSDLVYEDGMESAQ